MFRILLIISILLPTISNADQGLKISCLNMKSLLGKKYEPLKFTLEAVGLQYFDQEKDKYVMINDGRKSSVKYYYCEPSLLTVPTKDIKMPDSALSINLTDSIFNELMKASSVLQLMDLRICPSDDGSEIIAKLHDASDSTNNKYYISLGENPIETNYNFDFKMNLLRFVPGNYIVDFTETVISQFTHEDLDLTYWVALETTSKYGD